jgi:hypothetical protein
VTVLACVVFAAVAWAAVASLCGLAIARVMNRLREDDELDARRWPMRT